MDLTTAIEHVIRTHTGVATGEGIEVHANEIWNGSARKKTAFAPLESKERMKQFFVHLAREINRECPYVAVAVSKAQDEASVHRRTAKATLMNAALGRIDTNVKYFTGKHIGQPTYFLDPENESVTNYSNASKPGSYMPEAQVLVDDHGIKLYYSVDPIHQETDSRQSRLIQVADVAAYFVGKYLALYAGLYAHLTTAEPLTEASATRLADANYCLWLWDLLNIEAVFVQTSEQFHDQPSWTRAITERYQPLFAAGADLCICSMREAFPRRRLGGIGYWTVQKGVLSIRTDFIPAEG